MRNIPCVPKGLESERVTTEPLQTDPSNGPCIVPGTSMRIQYINYYKSTISLSYGFKQDKNTSVISVACMNPECVASL